jgi:hypothetical protein
MNPPDDVWREYLNELARLEQKGDISSQDYMLLRFSSTAKRELMERHFGDESIISVGSVQEILHEAQVAMRSDMEHKLRLEETARESAESEARTLNEAIANRLQSHNSQLQHLADKVGWIISLIAQIGVSILIVAGTYAGITAIDQVWGIVATAIVAILSICNLVFGGSVASSGRWLQTKISDAVYRRLTALFGIRSL